MPYANFDDGFPGHRKIRRLSDAAFRVHTQAILWCGRYLTDGYLAAADLAEVARPVRRYRDAVTVLEQSGLWVLFDVASTDPDLRVTITDTAAEHAARHGPGWMIHDYLQWNKSAAWWEAERARNRNRQARHRGSGNTVTDTVTNAGSHAVSHGTPDQTRPDQGGEARARPGAAPAGPPPRCPQHIDTPAAGPCGPCADARRALEAWQLRDAERRRTTPQCPRHRGWPADNCGPCRSERLAADDDQAQP